MWNALVILMISGKEEMLLMFGLIISWRHNHLYFWLPIFSSFLNFISVVPQNWSTTKAVAMCTYIIKNRQRWEERLWSHFLALHLESEKSWRVRRKKKPLSDKHHLLSKSFETPPQRDLRLLPMYAWLPWQGHHLTCTVNPPNYNIVSIYVTYGLGSHNCLPTRN